MHPTCARSYCTCTFWRGASTGMFAGEPAWGIVYLSILQILESYSTHLDRGKAPRKLAPPLDYVVFQRNQFQQALRQYLMPFPCQPSTTLPMFRVSVKFAGSQVFQANSAFQDTQQGESARSVFLKRPARRPAKRKRRKGLLLEAHSPPLLMFSADDREHMKEDE